MLCSILISNFNKSKYLKKCLNSVVNQTYKNIEVIFSDNDSDDDSIQIASKFKNIKIITTPRLTDFPALNQISVIFRAFDISKGNLIFLLDSDDFFEEDKIEKIIRFKNENKLDFITDIPRLYISENNSKLFDVKSKLNFFRSWPVIFPTSSICCTRELFLKFKDYSFEKNYERLEIDVRLNFFSYIKSTKKIFSNKIVTNYYQTNEGIMSDYKKFNKNWWEKRLQAHMYLHKLQSLNNIKINKNLDFYITNLICNLKNR